MGNFDDHPPRHTSVGDFNNPDRLNIYKQGGKSSFLDYFFGSRRVYFTCEELRVLILHGESPVICLGNRLSRKAYKKALEQQEKARIWLEEEKQAKEQQTSEDVME